MFIDNKPISTNWQLDNNLISALLKESGSAINRIAMLSLKMRESRDQLISLSQDLQAELMNLLVIDSDLRASVEKVQAAYHEMIQAGQQPNNQQQGILEEVLKIHERVCEVHNSYSLGQDILAKLEEQKKNNLDAMDIVPPTPKPLSQLPITPSQYIRFHHLCNVGPYKALSYAEPDHFFPGLDPRDYVNNRQKHKELVEKNNKTMEIIKQEIMKKEGNKEITLDSDMNPIGLVPWNRYLYNESWLRELLERNVAVFFEDDTRKLMKAAHMDFHKIFKRQENGSYSVSSSGVKYFVTHHTMQANGRLLYLIEAAFGSLREEHSKEITLPEKGLKELFHLHSMFPAHRWHTIQNIMAGCDGDITMAIDILSSIPADKRTTYFIINGQVHSDNGTSPNSWCWNY